MFVDYLFRIWTQKRSVMHGDDLAMLVASLIPTERSFPGSSQASGHGLGLLRICSH